MSIATFIPVGMLLITFILNMPITYGMIAAGVFYLLYTGADIGMIVGQVMGTMYSGYVLIAIPLFIFTANVMNSGKVTDAMFSFSTALIGKKKGALAYVNIVISLIFSGMTGSALADVAGIGMMEVNAMEKDGYDKPFSCAITAASATIGPIFPPSIPFVLYAMLSGASVGALFLGGMVPAFLIALVLAGYVCYISKKRNYPEGQSFTIKEFLRFTFRAFPALLTPIILLVGIYTGIMTPTEAGAVAALYALLISIFAYRILGFKDFLKTIRDTAISTGSVTIMASAATVFSYIVARENIPAMVSNFVIGITDNKYVLLLFINILFLILGMFLDTPTLLYVFLPMVLPIVKALNLDLVHFGVLISLNMVIGMCTPPFGFSLFVVSNIAKTPLSAITKEILPMSAVLIAVLLLITFVPQLVLFIPNMMA